MKTNDMIAHELRVCGMRIDIIRFPYTYHHDYVRHEGLARSEVAHKLLVACNSDMNEYDYSACYGAILCLISEQPETITKDMCDILGYVQERSVYGHGCDRYQMRSALGISI